MQNATDTKAATLSKADKAAAAKAANKTATDTKAAAPIVGAPKPADATISARAAHAAAAAAAREAGARHNTRDHNSIAIGVGVAKYAAKHAPGAAYAARVSSLPADTQTFFAQRVKAYAGKPFVALSNDNAKLARCINSGLLSIVSGARHYTDASGVKRIGAASGQPLMLQCVLADPIKPQA